MPRGPGAPEMHELSGARLREPSRLVEQPELG